MLVHLNTSYPIEICKSILRENTSKFDLIIGLPKGDKEFLTIMFGEYFAMMHRINYRNSFAPILYGKISNSSEGTSIRGLFMLFPYTITFLIILALLCRNWIYDMPRFIIPILLFFVLIFMGIYIVRKEPKLIVEFLKNRLNAR